MFILARVDFGEIRFLVRPKVFESIPMARPRSWGRWRIGRLMEVWCCLAACACMPSVLGWQRG